MHTLFIYCVKYIIFFVMKAGKTKIANILSFVFGPLWIPVIFYVMYKNVLANTKVSFLVASFVLQIVIPSVFVFLIPYFKDPKKWDIADLKQRIKVVSIIIFFTLPVLFLSYVWGYQKLINFNIALLVLLAAAFTITNFWKISLHAVSNTAIILTINYLYNWRLTYLFLIIPIVWWARLELKRHTIGQLAAGTILPILTFLLAFKFFPFS